MRKLLSAAIQTQEDIFNGIISAFNRWPWLWVPFVCLATAEILFIVGVVGSR